MKKLEKNEIMSIFKTFSVVYLLAIFVFFIINKINPDILFSLPAFIIAYIVGLGLLFFISMFYSD